MIAPITAIPSAPPTWRTLFRTAEPTPALSTGTEPIAAAVIGVITIAIPNPPMRSPGKTSQKFEVWSSRGEDQERDREEHHPAAMSQREPTRSECFPATGATRMMRTVIGRNDGARLDGRVAEDVLDEERVVEEDPEHREADEQHHVFAPAKVLFLNRLRSSIGARWRISSRMNAAMR